MSWLMMRNAILLAVLCVSTSGCLPGNNSPADERKEAHFLTGISRVNSMDYQGAIESFEKALEVNPRSASAHFELGLLYYQRANKYASAIHHFDKFLSLRPDDPKAERARECILASKQELAKTVSQVPMAPTIQRDMEQLVTENKRLKLENDQLKQQLEKWNRYVAYLKQQSLNQQSFHPGQVQEAQSDNGPELEARESTPALHQQAGATVDSSARRSYAVRQGDTPYSIARRHGVSLDELMRANPGLEPRKLQLGQVLNLPGS